MIKKISKAGKSKGTLFWVTLFSVIAILLALVVSNLSFTGWITQDDNVTMGEIIFDETTEIEIFADTDLTLEVFDNNISAILELDNHSVLPEQEVKFYLDDLFMGDEITDGEGYAQISVNLSRIKDKDYSIRVEFLGDSSLYLNPSSAEEKIKHKKDKD